MSAIATRPLETIHNPGGPKRWTVDQYLAMREAGIVRAEDRVELLDGEIIEKMGGDFAHIDGVSFLIEALRSVLGKGYHVRSQVPIRAQASVAEPDVAVLRGSHRDFVGRYPRPDEIVLVGEVSNSTLRKDRDTKAAIYARAGFAEYWILNVADRQLETFRNPLPSGVYGEARVYGEGEIVMIEGKTLSVAELLP